MYREKEIHAIPGIPMLLVLLMTLVGAIFMMVFFIHLHFVPGVLGSLLGIILAVILLGGLTVVNPGEGVVVQLFGNYAGTLRQQGFQWVNPFTTRRKVSMRVRNFESAKLKVNDFDGNPIEIAAVVVWQVADTAEAVFQVDDYNNFVKVQSEAALRNLATSHPYEAHEPGQLALRGHAGEIAENLKTELQDRLSSAGCKIVEARISHLAYAPEIASAMLQRQQASAIVAARFKIVEGAVGMVEDALQKLSERKVVTLDDDRRAAMVSNLLVVLCSDRHTQPVVNTGTLYP
jgi:hypothetical protein